jgi:hypothetical protein
MRREQSFVTRGLVMHWPSVLASANPLREGDPARLSLRG